MPRHAPLLVHVRVYVLRTRVTYTVGILYSCRANGGRQGSTGSWKGVHWLKKNTLEHHTYVHVFVDTATWVRVISFPDYSSLGTRETTVVWERGGREKILIFAYGSCMRKMRISINI